MSPRFAMLVTASLLAWPIPGALAQSQVQTQSDDPFERARRDIDQTFAQAEQDIHEDFRRFSQIINDTFARFEAEVREVWGDDPQMPEKTIWAGYSDDLETRVIIDYENGVVAVESVAEGMDEALLQRQLEQVLEADSGQLDERDLLARRTEDNLESAGLITRRDPPAAPPPQPKVTAPPPPLPSPPPAPPKAAPAKAAPATVPAPLRAEEHVRKDPPTIVFLAPVPKSKPAPPELKDLVDPARKPTVTKRVVKMPGGGGKTIKRAQVRMVPHHIEKQAGRFETPVLAYADERKVRRDLVFSIMKNESAFNPRARSHIPAYGLMQLVPNSGGADALQFLTGQRGVKPTPQYLYEPANNIQLGATYLHILYYRYLRRVKNPESRLYCAIAAYNTGAGNVARAFTGKRNITAASKVINKMTPDQVYDHLIKKLPYDETRRYLYKVRRDMHLFTKWEEAG